jgi:diketogulonate reductase-like aldo/keto reductase
MHRVAQTSRVIKIMPKQRTSEQPAPMSPDQRRRMDAHQAMEQRYMTAVTHGPTADELAAQKAEGAARARLEAAPTSASGGGDITLGNGVAMPLVGFGIADSQETLQVALQAGYRLLDTARVYRGGDHERDIGVVLRDGDRGSGAWQRDSIFVTTKTSSYGPQDNTYMWDPEIDARAGVLAEFEGCLERLQMDRVDLLLLHWPGPPPAGFPDRPNPLTPEQHAEKRLQMWRALETIYEQGRARAIGVSNYTCVHLSALLHLASVPPMVNQIECHLRSSQRALVDFCTDHSIAVTAYSPLAGCDLENPMLQQIATNHNVTPAAVALRFLTQRGIAVIPRSSNPDRIRTNLADAAAPSFGLSEEEMEALYALDEGGGDWQNIL